MCVRRVSACVIGEFACFTKGDSLRRAACIWPPRALSARCGACEPCLWHRCRDSRCVRRRSRGLATIERSRRSLPSPARDRRRRIPIRDAFHPSGAFAPQRSFERPAPALSRRAALPHRRVVDIVGVARVLRPIAPGPRSRFSLPTRSRFSGPGMPPDDFCNLIDARAHPTSSRFLAREWSSCEPRCSPEPEGSRLRWLPRCVAAPGAGEPRSARDGLRALRSTGVDRADRESDHPRKVCAVGRTLRVPFSKCSAHPSHRRVPT